MIVVVYVFRANVLVTGRISTQRFQVSPGPVSCNKVTLLGLKKLGGLRWPILIPVTCNWAPMTCSSLTKRNVCYCRKRDHVPMAIDTYIDRNIVGR